MNLNFNDTQTAFAYKSDKELKRAYRLFLLLSYPGMVKTGGLLAPFALNIGLSGIIRRTIYSQFVGGETAEECLPVIAMLSEFGIGSILDYSVEGKNHEEDFNRCLQQILNNIELAAVRKEIPFCVFKVTGLAPFFLLEKVSSGKELSGGEKEQWKKVQERVGAIFEKASLREVPVLVDAEESWIQKAIDDLVMENILRFNKDKCIVYNTYQLYRTDRLDFFKYQSEEALKHGVKLGAKLVRGAYMEKERKRAEKMGYPSPIHPDKESTDRHYNLSLEFGIRHEHIYLMAGTHNEESSLYLSELMSKYNIPNNHKRIWFSQLFGMSDHISFNLARAGYNVAKYLPYGPVKDVLPYLVRRAQENTSVKGQTGRELELIRKECRRRKI